ncbi:FtsX-like permease family protein [Candidatus Bathyarchaeota archaeon]|nr:FtsX-like permease family protein [Candidatus Bathyarchaeota archaeon]
MALVEKNLWLRTIKVRKVNPLDIFLSAIKGVWERKFRFFLNLVGILIGCTAITGLISITMGLTNNVSQQLDVFGPTNIIIIPGEIVQGQGIVGDKLDWRDLDYISRTSNIDSATPIIANKFCEYTIRGRQFRTDVYGVTEQYAVINKNTKIEEGRNFVRGDASVVIIGANIAQPNNEDEPIIDLGDRLKIKSIVKGEEKEMTLRVIGILEGTGGSFGFNLDDSIALPLKTAEQFYEVGGRYDFIIAEADSLEEVDSAVENIEDRFGDRITVVTSESAREQVGSVLGTIQSVLSGIAGISLLVAGIGIINTMTVTVMERTKEIGTMKAIGARSSDIMFLFLNEAAITGLVGGSIGAVFGFGLGIAIGRYVDISVTPTISLGLYTVGFALITSVLSGIYPAWRASNLDPVEALRRE